MYPLDALLSIKGNAVPPAVISSMPGGLGKRLPVCLGGDTVRAQQLIMYKRTRCDKFKKPVCYCLRSSGGPLTRFPFRLKPTQRDRRS
jgi:hypothetical protein